jgi:hypothetical protein
MGLPKDLDWITAAFRPAESNPPAPNLFITMVSEAIKFGSKPTGLSYQTFTNRLLLSHGTGSRIVMCVPK